MRGIKRSRHHLVSESSFFGRPLALYPSSFTVLSDSLA